MTLPPIGFGCSPFRKGGVRVELERAVAEAVGAGYRLFDVAEMYGNEIAVGRALGRSAREVALIGKAWRTSYRPAALVQACEASLRRLGVEAFDVYLLHAPGAWRHVAPLQDVEETGWPELERRAVPRDADGSVQADGVPVAETWEAMQRLRQRGLVRQAGVSNFSRDEIEQLSPLPAVVQNAVAALEGDDETVAFCRERGITLIAHSPLSGSSATGHPAVEQVAAALSCTPAQVVLRWLIDRGFVTLASSTNPDHIRENLAAADVELDAATRTLLSGAARLPVPG